MLRAESAFGGLRKKVVTLATLLEEMSNIPAVARELVLIQEVQGDDFWQDVTAPMLETVRRRLRALIKLIEVKGERSSTPTSRMRLAQAPRSNCKAWAPAPT